MLKKLKDLCFNLIATFISLNLLLSSFCYVSFASDYETGTISVNQIFNTSVSVDDNFLYTLKRLDNDCPMPDNINSDTCGFILTGSETKDITLNFTKQGIFKYQLYQNPDNKEFYEYDPEIYTITFYYTKDALASTNLITIIGNKNGDKVSEIIFTNSYNNLSEVTFDPPITKVVTVRKDSKPITVPSDFYFSMEPINNAPMPQANSNTYLDTDGKTLITKITGEGKVEFGSMTYDNEGAYEYVIKEIIGTNSSYTYDNTIYTMKVNVIKENNKLLVIPSYTKNNKETSKIEFINEYYEKKESGNINGGNSGSSSPNFPNINPTKEPETTNENNENPTHEYINPDGNSLGDKILGSIPKTGEEWINFTFLWLAIIAIAIGFIFLVKKRKEKDVK